ncbi:hypothetical protein CRENBAI_001895 [Crenichthys baileyi]|uniref:Uncharacterized protein n=1 Tax=Crenichthys baileyi TaxID=28760 RepID=A0AAV9SMM4_9TELE
MEKFDGLGGRRCQGMGREGGQNALRELASLLTPIGISKSRHRYIHQAQGSGQAPGPESRPKTGTNTPRTSQTLKAQFPAPTPFSNRSSHQPPVKRSPPEARSSDQEHSRTPKKKRPAGPVPYKRGQTTNMPKHTQTHGKEPTDHLVPDAPSTRSQPQPGH